MLKTLKFSQHQHATIGKLYIIIQMHKSITEDFLQVIGIRCIGNINKIFALSRYHQIFQYVCAKILNLKKKEK